MSLDLFSLSSSASPSMLGPTDPPRLVQGSARFSEDRSHRLELQRWWVDAAVPGRRAVCFIGLNPSVADATDPDMTVSKMVGFSQRWGFNAIRVVNLYTRIATDPRDLWAAPPEQPRADRWWRAVLDAVEGSERVVVCWGNLPRPAQLPAEILVKELQDRGVALWCIGETRAGFPRHPSRIAYDTPCRRWSV